MCLLFSTPSACSSPSASHLSGAIPRHKRLAAAVAAAASDEQGEAKRGRSSAHDSAAPHADAVSGSAAPAASSAAAAPPSLAAAAPAAAAHHELHCCVCLEEYAAAAAGGIDHTPRVLPCGHGVCTDCASTLMRNGAARCPECTLQRDISLPAGVAAIVTAADWARQLPLNRMLISVIKAQAQQPAGSAARGSSAFLHLLLSLLLPHRY